MSKPISQREARALRKRVEELESERERQRNRWVNDYPGGTNLGRITMAHDWLAGRIECARLLGHAVVVTESGDGTLNFYALPQARES